MLSYQTLWPASCNRWSRFMDLRPSFPADTVDLRRRAMLRPQATAYSYRPCFVGSPRGDRRAMLTILLIILIVLLLFGGGGFYTRGRRRRL
jgi:hypothetical protein